MSAAARRPGATWLLQAAAVAAAYAVSGRLGLLLALPPGYATAVWPPSGVALAGILLGGARLWPGVLLGSFLVNVSTAWDASTAAATAKSLALALSIAGGAALQAVLGARLIQRYVGYSNVLTQEVDVVRMLLLGGPLSCVVNSLIGTGSLWAAGLIPVANLWFNWWTWWVGDSIGVLIFMPLICAWSLHPHRLWLRRQISLSLPLAVMFTLVVCLFFFVSSREQTRLQAEFERNTQRIADAFSARLDNDLIILDGLSGFFTAADQITPSQFQLFAARQLRGHSDIRALEWLPRVTAAERPAFEAAIRQGGDAAFRIWERDARGQAVTATPRADYFPVTYVEPLAGNEPAVGYDSPGGPRRVAIEHAGGSGLTTASARIELVQDLSGKGGILVFAPVFRAAPGQGQALRGFCLAVFRLEDLARLSQHEADELGIRLRLLDNTTAAPAPLYDDGGIGRLKPAQIGYSRTVAVDAAERQWALEFVLPADYLVSHRSWQAWGLLAVGLLITGLLGTLILVLIARQTKVEELVQKRTADLGAAQDRFRRLLENAPDAMLIADSSGTIQLVNAQMERLFGYGRDEMVGQTIELLVPQPLRSGHVAHRVSYFARPQMRPMGAGLELWGQRKDGSKLPIEISLSPLETGDGPWATAAIRDISERKAAEQKVADYAKELERSNAELEQFAYAASHDLQAPLRSIVGFGQILQSEYLGRLDQEADTYLKYMVKSASQMQALIRDLLTYSRIGRGSTLGGVADCEAVLAEVKTQLQALIQDSGAQITHDPLPVVACAPLELGQILQNLIANAIKFQAPGKTPQVHLGAARQGRQWTLSVRDNGIGIDPRYRERIFQMFQRLHTPDKYEGTGIGLAICRKIVQRHGGQMWVESEAGAGSTFLFTLPDANP